MSKLEQLNNFIKCLDNPKFNELDELVGFLRLDKSTIESLRLLEKLDMIGSTCEIEGSIFEFNQLNERFIGDIAEVNIPLSKYRAKDCFFAKNIEELIQYGNNSITPPTKFLIYDNEGKGSYLYPKDPLPPKVNHFLQIAELLMLLERFVDHKEHHQFIFLHRTRVIIPTQGYNPDILSSELSGFLILKNILTEEGHKEEKANILKETLASFCTRIGNKNALEHLIQCFDEFSLRFEESYRSFAANFSFENVRREYEERNREYVAKLNTAFSEVANKLLTLPVSIFLVFSQIKILSSIKEPYKAMEALNQNIGLVILSLFIYVYIREITTIQRSTLEAIKTEFTGLMIRLKSEHPTGYQRVKEIDRALGNRYSKLKRGLLFADWVAFLSLILSLALFVLWI
ncbi:MAG: hypothetical protein OQK09_13720 [Colwellia sp.]|nr:hypothetical protein [Colwellia sp.]MCW8864225.1 hypothetical protein [Colwellia sp.]MCW9082565.1 hypothetical protein [Colwellia sp.]